MPRGSSPNSKKNLTATKPKTDRALQEWCREKSIPCAERVLELVQSDETKDADVIKGAELIMAYGYGRPREAVDVEMSGNVDSSFDIKTLAEIAGLFGGEKK